MPYTAIAGTGSYLPEKVLTNFDLEKMVDTSNDWILERTGISERRIAAEDQTCVDLAYEAALRALLAAGLDARELDLIICATTTPAQAFPSTACRVQHRLGCEKTPAFDVAAACAGFSYGLSISDQYIRTGHFKHILLIGSEVFSRAVDWQDRNTCVLFGDGAGAVVLSASDTPGIISTHIYADGTFGDILYLNNPSQQSGVTLEKAVIQMKGRDVFKHAVRQLGEMVDHTMHDAGLTRDDIDWFIPHQANIRIILATANRIGLPEDKTVLTVSKHGNTSSASIPLALDEAVRDGRIQRGHKLLLESFGGGLTWGSALIQF